MSVTFERFEGSPARTGLAVATVPALVAVVLVATVPLALAVAALGTVALVAGVRTMSRALVTLGAIALFGATVLAGLLGAAIPFVVGSAAASVVAWDAGTNVIGVTRQLGKHADTGRLIAVHTLVTTAVAGAVGTAAVAVFWASRGGRPTAAVAMLLVATVVFILLLDR